jgi:integrase
MAKKITFTKAALSKLVASNVGARVVVHDAKQPGLMAELREGGTLTFYLYRWWDGRPQKISIGRYPEVAIDGARKRVQTWIADQVKGIDPAAAKRAKREAPTLKDLFEHWRDQHAKQHRKTWPEDQRKFDKLLTPWHKRRLATIKRSDVVRLHAKLGTDHGHYAANSVLSLLRAIFNKSAADVGYEGPNPTIGVKKFRERSRDRFLQPSEIKAFFAALDAEPNETLRDFFRLALWTGARRSNVQAMAWADVDLDAAEWRIPETKNGEPQTVHLPAAAVEILERRKDEATGPWVLPGGRKNMTGHLSSPKAAWTRLCKRAGLADLRIHDLRRTLGSWQAASGASLPIIGKSLGHKSPSATAIYARMNLDPVRASVNIAVAAMLAAGADKKEEVAANG